MNFFRLNWNNEQIGEDPAVSNEIKKFIDDIYHKGGINGFVSGIGLCFGIAIGAMGTHVIIKKLKARKEARKNEKKYSGNV